VIRAAGIRDAPAGPNYPNRRCRPAHFWQGDAPTGPDP